ncbi:21344_t:CDS:2 [Dentiscutata erythropus]|uniref:21344_t:CDS:1 n=1 Tax=Dentiscutata erythropus TaxID=1348616 RepID=A0A9N9BXB4_9GLOM|nr:21344_t:CDS:2 [Dentiscutata erythropus]
MSTINFKEFHIDYDEFEEFNLIRMGGSGVVGKARWIKHNKYIILKQIVPKENEPENKEFAKELSNNANVTCVMHHLALTAAPQVLFLVLDYADLGDLEFYLSNNNDLKWEKKIYIVREIVCGLNFLHSKKILHRDLHAGNMLIKSSSSEYGIEVLITDFGLSKVASSQSVYDYPSDIYSLGVIMWVISNNGKKIFANVGDTEVISKIINGEREKPIDYIYNTIHEKDMISGKLWKETISNENTTILHVEPNELPLTNNISKNIDIKKVINDINDLPDETVDLIAQIPKIRNIVLNQKNLDKLKEILAHKWNNHR